MLDRIFVLDRGRYIMIDPSDVSVVILNDNGRLLTSCFVLFLGASIAGGDGGYLLALVACRAPNAGTVSPSKARTM